ncbi:MAG TPA: hypothetical protein VFV23_03465 [Verrucomicrobiae bacterium]|nr:hypothetical protein [Verrucomicrobiae bacterium]
MISLKREDSSCFNSPKRIEIVLDIKKRKADKSISMARKFFIAAVVTLFTTGIGFLAGAWIIIYGFMPEHPDIAPLRLFNDALSHMPFILVSFIIFEVLALGLVMNRVRLLSLGSIISIIAEVSGITSLVHGLFSDIYAFDTFWKWFVLGSAPIIIASTNFLIYLRTKGRSLEN